MTNIPSINSYWSPTTFKPPTVKASKESKENYQEGDTKRNVLEEELISKLEY